MLGAGVVDAVAIDLFAGAGALGMEALSRGAARVTFVERAQPVAAILRQNLESLGYLGRAEIVRSDAVRWLEAHPAEVGEAGLVLLDPPYGDPSLAAALAALDKLVGAGTIVVAER